jgi:hypothetical protein
MCHNNLLSAIYEITSFNSILLFLQIFEIFIFIYIQSGPSDNEPSRIKRKLFSSMYCGLHFQFRQALYYSWTTCILQKMGFHNEYK